MSQIIEMEETVSLSISPPPPSSSTTFSSSSPTVHRCTRAQARTPPALPQLPLRLSHARPQASSSPTTGLIFFGRSLSRTDGVRPKPNRSDPNDYVDVPATPERIRNPAHPVPSSAESRSNSRTDSGDDSKSSDTDFSKEKTPPPPPPPTGSIQGPAFSCKESIICPRCRLCRCTKCSAPRPLPPLHCCRSTPCLPEELAVCLSCLWCPRAAYARCVSDGTEESEFCSCGAPSTACCGRWTCLAAVVPCLPCLCLYWPLRWTLAACSVCRNCKRRGCRCGGPEQLASLEELLIVAEEPLSSNSLTGASRD